MRRFNCANWTSPTTNRPLTNRDLPRRHHRYVGVAHHFSFGGIVKIINWNGDIYTKHGYIAALVTIVVLVALAVGVSYVAGIDLKDIGIWLYQLG